MNFITIGQYFNKLQSALLVMMLIPLLAFLTLYLHPFTIGIQPDRIYLIVIPALVVCDWLIGFVLFDKKIKSIRNDQGLRVKLEKYFWITIVRYLLLASSGLFLAFGFLITGDNFFTWFFAGNLVLSGLLWPTSPKATSDLKLRGDEKEMVYYKKDSF